MAASEARITAAIASQMLAALEQYGAEVELILTEGSQDGSYARLGHRLDEIKRYASSAPQLSRPWAELLISHFELVSAVWQYGNSSGAVDVREVHDKHKLAVERIGVECRRLAQAATETGGGPEHAAEDGREVQALLKRIKDLEQTVRERDDFLAVASHELRSPLNGLALRLALLEKMAAEGGDAAALTAEIRRARQGADRYVRRAVVLLDVARMQSGRLEPVRTGVDVRALVGRVVDANLDDAQFHHAPLTADVEGDGIGWWDEHMIEQALSNLVNNAIKYGAGSPVALRARVAEGCAHFEVCDGGPGIDSVDRQRIFEKFERLPGSSAHHSGYGLGLWIAARMVAAHSGTIGVDTGGAPGCTFRVTLPLK
jgi:signal transduction histidine kinase